MAIDFTLGPELEAIRLRVREFIEQVVKPGEAKLDRPEKIERAEYLQILIGMRKEARAAGLVNAAIDVRDESNPDRFSEQRY